MYRVKSNGVSHPITLHAKKDVPDVLKNERIYFKESKSGIQATTDQELIGEVLSRQEMNIVRHNLQLPSDYYAWVEDVNGQNIAVRIVHPTEQIIERKTIAINLSKLEKPIKAANYLFEDSPFSEQQVCYIAQHEKTQTFYLFGKEVHGKGLTLLLNWEMDQLFAVKEEPMTYKQEEKNKMLKNAKFFIADLVFYDSTAQLQELTSTVEKAFPVHFGEEKGYISAWQEYIKFEKRKLDEIAAQCKPLRYKSFDISYGKVTFQLEGNQQVETWRDQIDTITVETQVGNKPYRIGMLRFVSQHKLEADYAFEDILGGVPFEKNGLLKVSKELEEVAQRRRIKALNKTISRDTILPDLGKYLSEPSTVGNIRVMKHQFPLHNVSTLVNSKIPDLPQEDAIKAALNTEDLVLIQGPPGTGKTSVIQTIMKCLIELGQQEILLTSYQHLAVDNAMQGLTEHGVLSHRFGGETYQQQLMATYQDIVEKMVGSLLQDTYYEDNENQFIEQLLVDLEQYAKQELNSAVIKSMADYVDRLQRAENVPTDVFIALIDLSGKLPLDYEVEQQIPSTVISMYEQLPKDVDSIQTAAHVEAWSSFMQAIHPYLTPQQIPQSTELVVTLQDTRRKMRLLKNDASLRVQMTEALEQLMAMCKIVETKNSQTDYTEVQQALKRVIVELQAAKQQTATVVISEEKRVLQEYAKQLRANPLDLAKVVGEYAQVKGATCQQTVAQRHGMYDSIFDAVIIDEAARANPLDLLIPMTLGKKIILVGDHKQLPHILEPDFEKESELSPESFRELYSKSLFERLFNELPTTKKVMLKKQFRMHPHIGRLVSKLFYPEGLQHGLGENALPNESGLYNGSHLAWLDVPHSFGGEVGRYYNAAEAEAVVKLVKQLLKDANNIGKISVITFYSEQLSHLKQQLEHQGLQDQVAIGTVDAFQGKESDIVILSTVRSNNFCSAGQALGFLRSPNRFNVALSRARSLLIVVGDSKTLRKADMFDEAYRYIEECGVIDKYSRA